MEQISFFLLNNPSNIYGMTAIRHPRDRTHRILVATVEKQVFSIEYSPDSRKFHCNEIHFAYIPNGADVISIDAFVRSNDYNDICLGITFFKNYKESDSNEFRKNPIFSNVRSGTGGVGDVTGNGGTSGGGGLHQSGTNITSTTTTEKNHYYFNIYNSSLVSSNGFDLNQIAQDCQPFELDFVPYHLYHTTIVNENKCQETLWLLSGSDRCVHIFREDVQKQCFYKDKSVDLFPELNGLESIVLWIDVLPFRQGRLSAVGCENGNVQLFNVELNQTARIVKSWRNRFDGPVLSVKLFTDHQFCNENRNLAVRLLQQQQENEEEINLLVMNSYDCPVVYRNVLEHGIQQRKNLFLTDPYVDIFLASFIGDLNFDRNNEILLGTYSKKMMVYKYDEERKSYSLDRTLRVSHPVSSISYLDLTGDGINELVIATTKGIFIYRHRMDDVLTVLSRKLDKCLLALT